LRFWGVCFHTLFVFNRALRLSPFFLPVFTLLYGFRSPRGRPRLSPWPPWTHLLGVKFSSRSWGLPRSPKGSLLSAFWEAFGSIFGDILGIFYVVRGLGGDAIYTMLDVCVWTPTQSKPLRRLYVCNDYPPLHPARSLLPFPSPKKTSMLHRLVLSRVRAACIPFLPLKEQMLRY